MVERALHAGVGAAWLTADAVNGSDYLFRSSLEGRGLGYGVRVRTDFAAWRGFRAGAGQGAARRGPRRAGQAHFVGLVGDPLTQWQGQGVVY
jgi:SRSO17 transposase